MALSFKTPDEKPDWVTDTQWKYLQAVEQWGSNAEAERQLGLAKDVVGKSLRAYHRMAARKGLAPGHFKDGVAPGYAMGKVTVQRAADGTVERTWERQSPEDLRRDEMLTAAIEAACQEIPRLAPIAKPLHTIESLLTQYTFTDYHLGMRAWAEEGGADWDLPIAEDLLTRCFEYLAAAAPRSKVGLICQLGDFMHFDSLTPVTPTSRHVVDASAHYQEIVRVAIRCLRRLVDFALTQHEQVVILAAEGNHDIASSVWMRELLKTLYENEPRVEVMDSPKPYYAFQWGRTMLAFSHGHARKKETLSQYFAAAFAKMWGDTLYRYGSSGHYHHEVTVKEEPGMKWRQFPTLAPNDSHSARGGYVSQRLALATTYSSRSGFAGEIGAGPEMLGAYDDAAEVPLAA